MLRMHQAFSHSCQLQAFMAYFYCHVGVVVDEVEVLPSDPPQRPTSVPQALQQNMPLASVSCPDPLDWSVLCLLLCCCTVLLSDH